MKKTLLYTLVILLFTACSKKELEKYNDAASGTSIYFPRKESSGNIAFSFGYAKSNVTDSIIRIVVRIIGAPVNTDRPYKLVVADSSTLKAGIDYEWMNKQFAIPSGKVADTLLLHLKRNAVLKKDSLFLYLNLQPNENFTNHFYSSTVAAGTTPVYYTQLKIKVDDIAGPPPFWTPGNSVYGITSSYLGTFSTAKFQLLINYYNLDIDEIIPPNWATQNGNYYRIIGWGNGLQSWLNYMASTGNTIYEADGVTPMKMGPAAK